MAKHLDRAVRVLNEMVEADSRAVQELLLHEVEVSPDVVSNPNLRNGTYYDEEAQEDRMTVYGLLNCMLGGEDGFISMKTDSLGNLVEFEKWEPAEGHEELVPCPICGGNLLEDFGSMEFIFGYPGLICRDCDGRAVNSDGEKPWIDKNPFSDAGDNMVFVDSRRCWRRFRFGGWVTMLSPKVCETEEEFYRRYLTGVSPFGSLPDYLHWLSQQAPTN